MKSLITLFFVLICGVVGLANTNDHSMGLNPLIEGYVQDGFAKMDNLLDSGTVVAIKFTKIKTATETKVVRLYKFKNSRIKKALAFRTKRNKAKMA